MKYILLTLFFTLFSVAAQSQNIYSTINGHFVAIGVYNSKSMIAESHNLNVRLNYSNGSFEARINLQTFDTGIDSLNKLIQSGNEKWISFKGKMGIDYINTKSHPLQPFDIVGTLTINTITKPITFKATLTHLSSGGGVACMLSANTNIVLSDFDLQKSLPEFSETINIQFTQAVLRISNN